MRLVQQQTKHLCKCNYVYNDYASFDPQTWWPKSLTKTAFTQSKGWCGHGSKTWQWWLNWLWMHRSFGIVAKEHSLSSSTRPGLAPWWTAPRPTWLAFSSSLCMSLVPLICSVNLSGVVRCSLSRRLLFFFSSHCCSRRRSIILGPKTTALG